MSEAGESEVTVRAAEMSDAPVLASLMGELGYPTRTSEMEIRLEEILKDPHYATFVAVTEGKVCGMIGTFVHYSYEHNNPAGRILALVVAEKMRGRKIGHRLINAAENNFAQRNIRRIAVYNRLTRTEAHRFYEQMGYEKNGWRWVKTLAASAD